MKYKLLITAFGTALAFSAANANEDIEKCKVIDENGNGLIKAHRADCKSSSHSCAGQNNDADQDAWIAVPKGDCAKLNAGDYENISLDILDKIKT